MLLRRRWLWHRASDGGSRGRLKACGLMEKARRPEEDGRVGKIREGGSRSRCWVRLRGGRRRRRSTGFSGFETSTGFYRLRYEILPLENQLEIANQIGTTRAQILSNLTDYSLSTSFL